VLLLVLDGDGTYDGLSVWRTGTGGENGPPFEGFIFDKELAMPDPIEPSAGWLHRASPTARRSWAGRASSTASGYRLM
jgi:hypothetical protein